MPEKQLYEFGPYRIDVALSRLERASHAVTLPPKAFDLLLLLAQNPDRVMGKSELIQALWPKTFVDDANLTQHVYTLRKALGDQPDGQPYIQTVARRGYRLAATVRDTTSGPPPASSSSTSTVVLEGERKQATVLHCAIANAAGIIERLGSNGMHALMRDLMSIATDTIERYEGVISQRQADGFIGVFGAPVVHEDDGERSILAARTIQRRFRALASDDEPLDLQIGIHTGTLVISRVADNGRVEYTAVGEMLRVANLLQQFATPGAILLSEATGRSVAASVALTPIDVPPSAGGRAYRVTGLVRETKAASRFARARAPFIGRHDELTLLEKLVDQAINGTGRVVSVVGEPGMGKSRLVAELTRRLTNRPGPVTTLEGRCVSYGSMVPYLPLTDLVRASCGVEESDSSERMCYAIDAEVAERGLPTDAASWLLRLLGIEDDRATSATMSPEAVKARTFDVLRLLLFKTAARHPLLVIVEDVHWIDRTSEEFLTTFVERLAGARVLLIVTHRPGHRVPWMDRSYVTQTTLSALSAADSARLVHSVIEQQPLDAEMSDAILSRGEGNPFFLEELARTVVEHGPDTHAIPETVHGVIMARIDRLPDVAKQLLQTASVVGREVPLSLLRRVWSGPAEVQAALAELCRLEFLFERPGGEDVSYVFKHALTQDVAYDSLLARNRRGLHLRAARALEELYAERPDDITATLAYHYARTDLVDEAVSWLMRAAEAAARVYANAEAILHLDLAARRLQRLPEGVHRDRMMVNVALQHAHSLYFLGQFRQSVEILLPHEARIGRLKDEGLTAAYSFWLAHMYSRLGDQRRATDSARRAIEAATTAGDEATLGKAHGLLALEGHWAGRPEEGLAHGARAVRLLGPHPDQRWWLGMAHFYLSINHLLRGDFESALAEAARADAVGKEIGDPRLQTYAGFAAGWSESSRGNHEAAIAACRKSLEQAPDRVSRAYTSLFLAYALLEHGDAEQAHARLEPVVVELEAFAIPQFHALAEAWLGDTLRLLDRLDEAEAWVARSLQVATRANYWYALGISHRISGRIARDRGAGEESSTAFHEASQIFERIGAAFELERTRQEFQRAVERT